ncbi:Hypothetical protein PSEBR_cmegm100 [Pseudomonas brassicacearum subsp. brassicacearum NFM421]|uniref:Uncharacterized protein n=1 Tax=Pseudomonas brassicacearum (strain NFM421) TaxID=994484 RepID=F2KJJ0_PSEBN|nr:hypothetical protein [Pseudomonas brassicacearum]AEA70216.1 Hypothetical protein PSEBR_cmegm100 [Pseudomonas brassicacearum subsp. brassicacearum NFM421]
MPKYMLDYIRLCRECSHDISTIGTMRSIVIPTLQREAAELRSAVAMVPEGCPELQQDAELLESASSRPPARRPTASTARTVRGMKHHLCPFSEWADGCGRNCGL